MHSGQYRVIVIGGGHAGVEAAWAAANLLPCDAADSKATVALVTIDPTKVGVMSCNPAIGGLAKGQIVREIDAMGGLMGLATDATGIQFKVLNTSKGPAVHGPRAQCDKHAYAEAVQRLIASRPEIEVIAASVEELIVEHGFVRGVVVRGTGHSTLPMRCASNVALGEVRRLDAGAVVLTTGTFMRGLMHTGEAKTEGGRFGEAAAVGISGALKGLGFELGRLKTGTPPRLERGSIDWAALEPAGGDALPTPFSDLTRCAYNGEASGDEVIAAVAPSCAQFPVLEQVECRITHTSDAVHGLIRGNLHRAPMYSGQIEGAGPRYCPSIEDKVVRFAEKQSHQVFLEPESLRDDWIYCNGISTSLPADVQDAIVRSLPGCERARILRYGYAVEYDMVKPHQISATGMTKRVEGLFLAGQINGTSGYEEAAGQGLIAGINAARRVRGEELVVFARDAAYIGVMMDDLVTKTPTEPYRMFTSRAEHRLLLRADNTMDRLTPLAEEWGLLATNAFGRVRLKHFADRKAQLAVINAGIDAIKIDRAPLKDLVKRPEFGVAELRQALRTGGDERVYGEGVLTSALADRQYAIYIQRQHAEVRRQEGQERRRIPQHVYREDALSHMRTEARLAMERFRPETFGQAGRLEGITPADLTLLSVLVKKFAGEPPSAAMAQ